jgi:hypothetical protein
LRTIRRWATGSRWAWCWGRCRRSAAPAPWAVWPSRPGWSGKRSRDGGAGRWCWASRGRWRGSSRCGERSWRRRGPPMGEWCETTVGRAGRAWARSWWSGCRTRGAGCGWCGRVSGWRVWWRLCSIGGAAQTACCWRALRPRCCCSWRSGRARRGRGSIGSCPCRFWWRRARVWSCARWNRVRWGRGWRSAAWSSRRSRSDRWSGRRMCRGSAAPKWRTSTRGRLWRRIWRRAGW